MLLFSLNLETYPVQLRLCTLHRLLRMMAKSLFSFPKFWGNASILSWACVVSAWHLWCSHLEWVLPVSYSSSVTIPLNSFPTSQMRQRFSCLMFLSPWLWPTLRATKSHQKLPVHAVMPALAYSFAFLGKLRMCFASVQFTVSISKESARGDAPPCLQAGHQLWCVVFALWITVDPLCASVIIMFSPEVM
jgi:hypothetical protein